MRKKTSVRKGNSVSGTEKLDTVGDWLRFAVSSFGRAGLTFAQGLHGPQEEATFLVSRFLGIAADDLPHFLTARLTPREVEELRELVRRRMEEHVPVPYLVGEAVLGGHSFHVDERVLVPRSYVAALLPDAVVAFAGPRWKPARILELGTGSGCLAVLAAHAFPEAIVDAVDVSPDALEVAVENVRSHGLDDRVHLLESDLFEGVPPARYDLIIANPPYEPSALVDEQPPELAREPRLALDGGVDGMALVRRIVAQARAYLSSRGVLVLELGGLRLELLHEFPALSPHVFDLPDGTDAVLGFHARGLPNPAR
ncbi:50S ribosomal protein L3 N(5)-glutamine methyltransferase [Opitutales bacterium ASA1]|uniref:50S ribosomal protein L3 N(5)-glutamine methyltransferase n=1 Tax=Congregicoccus parvus TaxID=3081749 RepID=UPI002B29E22F|nr:50S ribosomal protein L3 N(5)-glutamine methyltransferase [Opitutales bacterium ASA1]